MPKLLLTLILTLIVALSLHVTEAQTPPEASPRSPVAPAPAPSEQHFPSCSRPAKGGETVSVSYLALLEVTLPSPGDYTHGPFLVLGPAGVTNAGIEVCHVQTGSWIRISAITGQEISRNATSPEAQAILDKIAASARLRQLSEVAPVNTASSPPPGAIEGLRYRLQVGRDANRPAPDGTRVSVRGLPRPPQVPGLPVPKEPCAEGIVSAGRAEIVVWLTAECPAGLPVGLTLFIPGALPIRADAVPPFEWRAPLPGETNVIDAVVRPVPPRTGGPSDTPASRISPPITGSAGLLHMHNIFAPAYNPR